jgi:hypothetical protein
VRLVSADEHIQPATGRHERASHSGHENGRSVDGNTTRLIERQHRRGRSSFMQKAIDQRQDSPLDGKAEASLD